MCKYSIIIPVYNAEDKIDRCLQSIIHQSFEDFEVILINDGSRDTSMELCKKYAEQDERIHFINKSNGGVSSARNAGLNHASGEFILFVDADDWLSHNTLKTIFHLNEKREFDIFCFSSIWVIKKEGNIKEQKICFQDGIYENHDEMVDFISNGIETELINTVWGKVYRRNVILQNNLNFDEKICYGEDYLFNMQYFQFAKSCGSTRETLYYYSIDRDSDSLTHKYNPEKMKIFIEINSRVEEIVKSSWGNVQLLNAVNLIKIKNIYSVCFDIFNFLKWKNGRKQFKQYTELTTSYMGDKIRWKTLQRILRIKNLRIRFWLMQSIWIISKVGK